MTTTQNSPVSPVYEGQFGTFTIDKDDRIEVMSYRIGLAVACISLCVISFLILTQPLTDKMMMAVTFLFYLFIAGLGVSLQTIHIYLKPLHNALKVCWLFGLISTVFFSFQSSGYLVLYTIDNRFCLFGIGFVFASLTGLFIKEAFCFNRLEAKFLVPIIPALILGFMFNVLPLQVEQFLLTSWCLLFTVFILRKSIQDIPSDVGDKSVFAYLKRQNKA